jgi:hypothetical protein
MMRLKASALILVLILVLVAPVQAQQPDLQRAGLVVVHGDGSVVSACVAFAEESISSADLLRRAGLEVVLTGYGGLGYGVCAIGGEGCAAGQDCFCRCRGNPCAYWVSSHRSPNGSWAISGVGASAWQVHDGDVDGWVWGDGSTAPPTVSFAQVCPSDPLEPVASPAVSDAANPATTSAPLSLPAVTVSLSSTNAAAAPAPATGAQERGRTPLGYVVFGVVALGLAGWLVVAGLRGRSA